jgi:hypothetical protein
VRRRPADSYQSLGEALADCDELKSLPEIMAAALGLDTVQPDHDGADLQDEKTVILEEPDSPNSSLVNRTTTAKLTVPIRDLADWTWRIEDKNAPDHETIISSPDAVKFVPEHVAAETRALIRASGLVH